MVTRTRTTAKTTATAKAAAPKRPAKAFNPTDNIQWDYDPETGLLTMTANLSAGYSLSDKGNKIFARHGFSNASPEGLDDFMFNVVIMERPAPKAKPTKTPATAKKTNTPVVSKPTGTKKPAAKPVIVPAATAKPTGTKKPAAKPAAAEPVTAKKKVFKKKAA